MSSACVDRLKRVVVLFLEFVFQFLFSLVVYIDPFGL